MRKGDPIKLPWSNDQTEGNICTLKTLTRHMGGRANLDLLMARLMPVARNAAPKAASGPNRDPSETWVHCASSEALGAGIGMLVVETVARIRRAFFVLGMAIKEICREFRLSRKVVRKVIRSDETAFTYQRSMQPGPRLGPWIEELDRLLEANAARSARDRVTLTRVFEDLRGLGDEGGYDAVRRYAAS